MSGSLCLRKFKRGWKFFVAVLTPLVLIPLIVIEDADVWYDDGPGGGHGSSQESMQGVFAPSHDDDDDERPARKYKMLFIIILMAVYWILEVIPPPVTALLPLLLFPLFGIRDIEYVAQEYAKESNLIFLTGMIVSIGLEYCNLHKRIAVRVMSWFGGNPLRGLWSTMAVTAFLAMWLSSTTCVVLILPVVTSLIDKVIDSPAIIPYSEALQKSLISQAGITSMLSTITTGKACDISSCPTVIDMNGDKDNKEEEEQKNRRKEMVRTMYLLGITYAANIGGTAVITGASPNKVFKEAIKRQHISQDGLYKDITFFRWIAINLPPVIINVLVAGVYLALPLLKEWMKESAEEHKVTLWKARQIKIYLKQEYERLGKLNYHQVAVGTIFVLVVLLWIFREPGDLPGWSELIYSGAKFGDSMSATLGCVLLFIVPKSWGFLTSSSEKGERYEPLLDWKFTVGKIPWSVMLLLGSGFALEDGIQHSGLAYWIGENLKPLGKQPLPLLLLVIIITVSIVTEFMSNVACATLIIPIVISLSRSLQIHPLYLTIPATVACSYSFILPVSNPTNTIAFEEGNFTLCHKIKTGLVLNVICIVVLFVNQLTIGDLMFDFNNYEYPEFPSSG